MRKLSVKINFFFDQGENAMNPEGTISGNDVYCCSEEARKMAWMREMRIRLVVQMELEEYRNEIGWLIRCHNYCIFANYPEEDYPSRPPPIPPGYTEKLERRMKKTVKRLLPPTLKMILKTYDSQPVRQAPVHPKHPEILSCSQQPMPYTEPESLGNDQTKSASFGAQTDGWKEERLETLLAVQPEDIKGNYRDGEHPLERRQVLEKQDLWLRTALRTQIKWIFFFKPRLGWNSKHQKSPLTIS